LAEAYVSLVSLAGAVTRLRSAALRGRTHSMKKKLIKNSLPSNKGIARVGGASIRKHGFF
jgi:hypothetical protein